MQGIWGCPAFLSNLLQWQEHQVLPSALMEAFSQAEMLTAQSFCGKEKIKIINIYHLNPKGVSHENNFNFITSFNCFFTKHIRPRFSLY